MIREFFFFFFLIVEFFFLNQMNAQPDQLPKVKWELLKLCLGILIKGRDASSHSLSFQCPPALQAAKTGSIGDPWTSDLGGWSLPSSGYSVEVTNILLSLSMATVGIYRGVTRYLWACTHKCHLNLGCGYSVIIPRTLKLENDYQHIFVFRKQMRRWMLEREVYCAVRFLP